MKGQKPETFPHYPKENIDGEKYVNSKVAYLQSGQMDFNFLTYLAANPGLPVHKITNIFRYAYSNLSQVVMVGQGSVPAEIETEEDQDTQINGADEGEAISTKEPSGMDILADQVGGPEREAHEEVQPMEQGPGNTEVA